MLHDLSVKSRFLAKVFLHLCVELCCMASDGRDWHSYNEALVRRGELNLDSSVMEEWKRELKKENEGKIGEPYHYPESYIRLLAFVRLLFHRPYRQTEGFVHFLSRFVEGLQVPDYSTINRR